MVLGLLLGVVMTMGGIYRGLFADALAVLNATGADVWVVQQDTNGPFAENSRIPEDLKYRIRAVPGVAEASPLSFQTIQIERKGKPFRFFLIGYELNGFGGPPGIIAATMPATCGSIREKIPWPIWPPWPTRSART